MRVVIQRVTMSSCTVDNNITGRSDKGFMLLIGFTHTDTLDIVKKVVNKIIGMRIFEDENGKLNKSLKDINGTILAISQFTLYADCKHGNRPSFTQALGYEKANELYEETVKLLNNEVHTECGIFGADMKIELINDGPVTIILDSDEL